MLSATIFKSIFDFRIFIPKIHILGKLMNKSFATLNILIGNTRENVLRYRLDYLF